MFREYIEIVFSTSLEKKHIEAASIFSKEILLIDELKKGEEWKKL